MANLQGEALRQAFRGYLEESIRRNRRPATTDEIRWFSERFLSFVGTSPLTLKAVQEYLDMLLFTGIKSGRRWKISSVKNEYKIIKKIWFWLVEKGLLDETIKKNDIVMPEDDDNEEFELSELPSMEVAQEIVLLTTEPGKDDHKLHRHQKKEMRDAFNFMLRTGIRVGELRKLKGTDLLLDAEVPSYKSAGRSQ